VEQFYIRHRKGRGKQDRSGMIALTLTGLDRRGGSLVGSTDDEHVRVGNGSSGSGGTGGGTHDDDDGGGGSGGGGGGSYDDVDDAVRGERDDGGGGGDCTTSDVSVSANWRRRRR